MRVLLVGHTGRIGSAVRDALAPRHEVVTASRSGGDVTVDLREPASITAMYEQVGPVDAVACAAGSVPGSARLASQLCEVVVGECHEGAAGW
jgi:nucleoside-diphosphate-sugar epimerase